MTHAPPLSDMHEKKPEKDFEKGAEKAPEKDFEKASGTSLTDTIKVHQQGHRKRLRQRFLKDLGLTMADYELLEMILFRAIPRRDVKTLAKTMIAEFGNLAGVLSAPLERLMAIKGVNEQVALECKLSATIGHKILHHKVIDRPIITSWAALVDYCIAKMAHSPIEEMRVLFLSNKNVLIKDEVLQKGTLDRVAVYPRQLFERIFSLGASGFVLIHNHPSDDPTPSAEDIKLTNALVKAARLFQIQLHDHLIVGRNGYASFKNLGLL